MAGSLNRDRPVKSSHAHNKATPSSCWRQHLDVTGTSQIFALWRKHREQSMPNIDRIDSFADELTAIRRDLHAHPEIGFEEHRTSGIVAEKLQQWGIEVHRGVGGTGVVGLLKGNG